MKKLLAALLVAASAIPASATIFHYTLSNATFTDGGVMTGGFDYDSENPNAVQNFSFSTTSGGGYAGRSYTNANTFFPGFNRNYIYAYAEANYNGYFEIVTDSFGFGGDDLTSGSTLGLDERYDTIHDGNGYRYLNEGAQLVVTNTADVPEPAMLGLFGLGAIGLGLSRRRKAA